MKKDGIQTRKRKPKSSVSSKESSSKSSKTTSSVSGKAVWELGNQYPSRNTRPTINDTYTARKSLLRITVSNKNFLQSCANLGYRHGQ